MDVRILGPVQVEVDGTVRCPGPRLAALLALLALAGGRVVTRARLAELVWDDGAVCADATLRSHVLHLRRLLEPHRAAGAAPRLLVTEGAGYALRLAAEQLDATRFERLVERGQRALHAGSPAGAAADLRAALALWHGPVLADVAERSFAIAECARLEELRHYAVRTRIEADLALGRHVEVTGELIGLLAEDPCDERLRIQLAIALCRGNRQEDALRVCRDGLRLLHDRGLTSAVLRTMQQDILREAPGLGAGTGPVRPFHLPPDIPDFTGRTAEVAALRAALLAPAASTVTSVIHGKPGVGKSALAVHVAHALRDRFPDGTLYVNLGGGRHSLTASEVLGRFMRAMGLPDHRMPTGLDDAVATYRSMLADRRVLVVLDDAGHAGQVRPLLPGGGGCAVVVTSRRPLVDLVEAGVVTLDLLTERDATELLGRLAGADRVDAEPDAAGLLVGRCGLLPLAVRIAGARLAARPNWSLAGFAGRLADERRRLAELTAGELAVRSSFLLSYRELGDADARVFRLLGLLDTADLTCGAAAALVQRTERETEEALERLVDAQLLETPAPGRYRFHDLLRLYARECADADETEPCRRAAIGSALGWYLRGAELAGGWLVPSGDPPDAAAGFSDRAAALDWLESERGNLVAAAVQAAGLGRPVAEVAWRLSEALQRFLDLRKHWPEWEAVCRAALAAARAAANPIAEGRALRLLGVIFGQRRDYPNAAECLHRALAISRQVADRAGEAGALNNLGAMHGDQGRYRQAIPLIAQGVDAYREVGDRIGQARALNNLAVFHSGLRRFADAERYLRECMAINTAAGDDAEVGADLETLGVIYLEQGRFADAIDCFLRCLPILRTSGDRYNEANALRGLGVATAALRGAAAGRDYLAEALAIFTGLHAPEADDVQALL